MGYNPIQDWLAGAEDGPGPEEQLLLPAWERGTDSQRADGKVEHTPTGDVDARHGRGYVVDSGDDRKTSEDGLIEAGMAALFGVWVLLPAVKRIWWFIGIFALVTFLLLVLP